MSDDDRPVWVHESDYGSPAFGDILIGALTLVVGIVELVAYGVQRLFRGH